MVFEFPAQHQRIVPLSAPMSAENRHKKTAKFKSSKTNALKIP